MNESRQEYRNDREIRRTLVNFIENRRVRTIPNILRRRRRSWNVHSSDRASAHFITERIESLFNPEFGRIINPFNAVNEKRVNSTQNVGRKYRKRKQVICQKSLSHDDENRIVCSAPILREPKTEKMDSTVASSSAEDNRSHSEHLFSDQSADDHKQSSASQNFQDNTVFPASSNYLNVSPITQSFYNYEVSSASHSQKDWRIAPTSDDNHRVSTASQDTDQISLPSLLSSSIQSPPEFHSDNNNSWMDIQNIIEVDFKQQNTNANEILANEINSHYSGYFQKKSQKFWPPKEENYWLNGATQMSRHCCFMCEKTYKSKASLRYHLKHIHNFYHQTPEVPKVLTCDWCSKNYRRVNAYEKHLSNHVKNVKN